MRIVLDSNVLIPGLVMSGTCRQVVRHCLARHQVVASEYPLREVQRKLTEKLRLSAASASEAIAAVRTKAMIVVPASLPPDACRDPKDIPILGTAVAGNADILIAGDRDLLDLGFLRGVKILPPGEFWRNEQRPADS